MTQDGARDDAAYPRQLAPASDTSFPILLGSDGRVMDGMHRILKVTLEGGVEVEAKQFVRYRRHDEPASLNHQPRTGVISSFVRRLRQPRG